VDRKLVQLQNWFGRYREEKNLLPWLQIKLPFHGCPACSPSQHHNYPGSPKLGHTTYTARLASQGKSQQHKHHHEMWSNKKHSLLGYQNLNCRLLLINGSIKCSMGMTNKVLDCNSKWSQIQLEVTSKKEWP
jgi:hypothetical protein